MPSSRGSFQPRDQAQVSCIAGRFFTTCESPGKHSIHDFCLFSYKIMLMNISQNYSEKGIHTGESTWGMVGIQ